MARLKIQEIASKKGYNISQLQIRAGISMGAMRRYWYGTKKGTAEGEKLTEVDLDILGKIAGALELQTTDLIENWQTPVAAIA